MFAKTATRVARSADGGVGGGRRRPWVGRLTLAVALLLAAGCANMTHQEQRDQAHRRWEQVRAKVKVQLGTQQFDAGEIDAAINTVREALGLNPMATESYLLLARALLEKGDPGEAGRILVAAEELGLESADLTYTRGVVAERGRDLEQGLAFYRRARQQDPSQIDYLVAEAECLVAAERPEEARELVRASVDQFDRDGTLDTLAAEISLVLGDQEEAAASFRRAMPLVGDDRLVAEEYGLLLAGMGRFAEAVAVLQPRVDAAGEAGEAVPGVVIRRLAQSYLELGHTELPGELLSGWLRRHPDDAAAWFLQARAAMARHDEALARRCAAAVQRLAPGSAQTYLLCGYVRWRQGNPAAALKVLERSLALEPNDALLHCLIGQVLVEANEIERARRHWRRALQIDPDARWAQGGLKELDGRAAG